MFLNSLQLSFIILYSSLALATPLVTYSPNCICDPNIVDRLENPKQISFGAFNGQCVDSCKYRRSKLAKATKNNYSKHVHFHLTNLLHENQYWTAQIPVDAVQTAQIGFEEFIPGIYHVFLVFNFPENQPVRLQSQLRSNSSTQTQTLVLSAEGIPPKNGEYNFIDAYMGRYVTGVRMMSLDQIVHWSVKIKNRQLVLYTFEKGPQEIAHLLKTGLLESEKNSFDTVYDLFKNNCATNTMDWIDQVFTPERPQFPIYYSLIYPIERAIPIRGPFSTFDVLVSRNLIRNNPQIIN